MKKNSHNLTDESVPLDLGGPSLTEAGQVTHVVLDVLQRVGDHHDSHVVQVLGRYLEHLEDNSDYSALK